MKIETIEKLWSFYRHKIDIYDFEKWIYLNNDLEIEIGNEKYLELISLSYKNKNDYGKIVKIVKSIIENYDYKCSCVKLYSRDIIGMGSEDEIFMDKFIHIKDRGQDYWWLYLSQCTVCNKYWLVAQEERHNDDYHLLKLTTDEAKNILENDNWPHEFDKYENLLILSKNAGHSVRFVDPLNSSMVYTVIDLAKNKPNINVIEIAELLNIDNEIALELSKIAMQKENVNINFK